ncbi:MAG: STAS domain-containing protein [Anaerolineae bacterium]
MAFSSSLDMSDGVAKITLDGELDATAAPAFRDTIEQAAAGQPQRLVLLMQGLEYMASAGVRVLIFAKQKMGANVDIYAIAPTEQVLSTLQKTGVDRSIIVQDKYEG